MKNVWPLQRDCDSFYGNPRMPGDPERCNPAWMRDNLVMAHCPWALNAKTGPGVFVVHKKCHDSIERVMNAIWERVGKDQKIIHALKYDVFDGCFNYRNKRGGSSLSCHAYAAATDWDAADQPFHQKPKWTDNELIVVKFKEEDWCWGGDWSPGSQDGMHVQACRVHP